MTPHELAGALCGRFGLTAEAVPKLASLLESLADPSAPTTVHDPPEACDVHLADSLSALSLREVVQAGTAADLGAGAGFPGLALAAALPSTHFTLVESVGRKAQFIEAAAERAGLSNVTVAAVRAEEWQDGLGRCDLITARALAALPVLAEYAAPLLVVGGALVAWKGRRNEAEEADGRAAAAALGMGEPRVVAVEPFPESQNRHLHVYLKVAEAPPGYPRRAGMAAKRPLRANGRPRPGA